MGMGEGTPMYVEKDNDFMGGGMWIFFLFILLLFKDGGFGGNTAGAVDTFALNDVQRQLQGISNGICDSTFALNNGINGVNMNMMQGFNGVQSNIAQLGFNMQQCCCETNRNIDAIRYENAKNTCDVVNAIRTDGDATRALITQNEMQSLRDQLNTANLQLSQQAQSANLIATLRPTPIPAYPSCSPYAAEGCFC